ncbi:MAG: nitrogenase component 1 [Lachnospiraceae bacterium]|nr:nitrogenase component 1 [Lachnospiraceae bacterium]
MSLTRFLPVPSDRMGIIWSLLSIKDAVVVEYGPAGTTHYSMSLYGDLGIEQENRLFTTHMREEDVVMGDTTRLENALIEIDKNYAPKVIFVVASSCSAVIGTDLKGVCTMIAPKVEAKLITFEQGGFRGDYSAGIRETYKLLTEKIVDSESSKKTGTYNILGASIGSYRCKSDINEINRMLEETYAIKLGACLCLGSDLEQIKNMGTAELNVVIRPEAIDAAEFLEKKYGIPYIYGMPYGYRGSSEWLMKVGMLIGKAPAEKTMSALKEKSMSAAQYKMYGRMLKRDKAEAYVYGDAITVKGLSEFLGDMGITPVHMISIHNVSGLKEIPVDIKYIPNEKDRLDILKEMKAKLVLADDTSARYLDKSNTYMRIANPVIDGAQVAEHMPVAGIRGADMLMEYVAGYFNTLR